MLAKKSYYRLQRVWWLSRSLPRLISWRGWAGRRELLAARAPGEIRALGPGNAGSRATQAFPVASVTEETVVSVMAHTLFTRMNIRTRNTRTPRTISWHFKSDP